MFPWAFERKTHVFHPDLCAVIIHFRKPFWVYFEDGRHCSWLGELWPSWSLHVVSGKAVGVKLLPFLSHCQNTRLESQIAFPLGLSAGRWDQAVTFLSVGKWKCTGKLDPSCCWKESLDGNTCTLSLCSFCVNLLLARRQTGSGQWEWLASQYTRSALPSRPEQCSKKGSSFFTLTFGFVF